MISTGSAQFANELSSKSLFVSQVFRTYNCKHYFMSLASPQKLIELTIYLVYHTLRRKMINGNVLILFFNIIKMLRKRDRHTATSGLDLNPQPTAGAWTPAIQVITEMGVLEN